MIIGEYTAVSAHDYTGAETFLAKLAWLPLLLLTRSNEEMEERIVTERRWRYRVRPLSGDGDND